MLHYLFELIRGLVGKALTCEPDVRASTEETLTSFKFIPHEQGSTSTQFHGQGRLESATPDPKPISPDPDDDIPQIK